MTREERKANFVKNYTGIYNPELYFEYVEACEKIDADYKNVTYNPTANIRLARTAKQDAFNRIMRVTE